VPDLIQRLSRALGADFAFCKPRHSKFRFLPVNYRQFMSNAGGHFTHPTSVDVDLLREGGGGGVTLILAVRPALTLLARSRDV
jgi:hypothetical protein